MADQGDVKIDALIARVLRAHEQQHSALMELKVAQAKEEADDNAEEKSEASEETSEGEQPKDLKAAAVKARSVFRSSRRKAMSK